MLASFAVVTTLRADFNDDKFDVLVSVVAVTTCLTSFCTTMASGMFIIFLNGIPVETYQDEQNVHASGVFIWGFLFIYIAFGFSCLFTVTLVMLLAYAGLATGNQDEEVVAIVVMTIGPCCCFVIYVCCFCISCVGQPPMSSNGPAEKMDVEAQRPTTRATDDMDRVTDSTDDEVDITTESNSSGSLTASSRSS